MRHKNGAGFSALFVDSIPRLAVPPAPTFAGSKEDEAQASSAIGPIMDLQGDSIGAPQEYVRQTKRALDLAGARVSSEFVVVDIPVVAKKWLRRLRGVILSRPVLKLAAEATAKEGI